MTSGSDPLAELRDIHLPPDPSWWPPAVGWWLLALIVIGLLVVAIAWLVKWLRWRAPARSALHSLRQIGEAYSHSGDTQRLCSGLSILLKRYMLVRFPREDFAGLSGDGWLGFLDRVSGTTEFSQGAGQVLVSAPYRKQQSVEAPELLRIVRRAITGKGRP